jgi:hypothetical protein
MGWNEAITATASTSMSRSSRTSRRTSTAYDVIANAGTQPAVLPALQASLGPHRPTEPATEYPYRGPTPGAQQRRHEIVGGCTSMTCPTDPVKLLSQLLHGERASATPNPCAKVGSMLQQSCGLEERRPQST